MPKTVKTFALTFWQPLTHGVEDDPVRAPEICHPRRVCFQSPSSPVLEGFMLLGGIFVKEIQALKGSIKLILWLCSLKELRINLGRTRLKAGTITDNLGFLGCVWSGRDHTHKDYKLKVLENRGQFLQPLAMQLIRSTLLTAYREFCIPKLKDNILVKCAWNSAWNWPHSSPNTSLNKNKELLSHRLCSPGSIQLN